MIVIKSDMIPLILLYVSILINWKSLII